MRGRSGRYSLTSPAPLFYWLWTNVNIHWPLFAWKIILIFFIYQLNDYSKLLLRFLSKTFSPCNDICCTNTPNYCFGSKFIMISYSDEPILQIIALVFIWSNYHPILLWHDFFLTVLAVEAVLEMIALVYLSKKSSIISCVIGMISDKPVLHQTISLILNLF